MAGVGMMLPQFKPVVFRQYGAKDTGQTDVVRKIGKDLRQVADRLNQGPIGPTLQLCSNWRSGDKVKETSLDAFETPARTLMNRSIAARCWTAMDLAETIGIACKPIAVGIFAHPVRRLHHAIVVIALSHWRIGSSQAALCAGFRK